MLNSIFTGFLLACLMVLFMTGVAVIVFTRDATPEPITIGSMIVFVLIVCMVAFQFQKISQSTGLKFDDGEPLSITRMGHKDDVLSMVAGGIEATIPAGDDYVYGIRKAPPNTGFAHITKDSFATMFVDGHMQLDITDYKMELGDMATEEEKEAAEVLSNFMQRVFKPQDGER